MGRPVYYRQRIINQARSVQAKTLLNQGMPTPAIRKVLGFSRKLVDKYIKLYREYCGPEYAFMSGKLRRLAEAHPVKKTTTRRNEHLANQEGYQSALQYPSCQGS